MDASNMNGYRGTKSTKFQLTLLTLLLGTVLALLDKMSGTAWGLYVVGLVATYVTGDVGSRFAAAKAATPPQ